MSKLSINTEVDYFGGSKRWENEKKAELEPKQFLAICESYLFVLKQLKALSYWVEVMRVSFSQPERRSSLIIQVTVILTNPLNSKNKIEAFIELTDSNFFVDALEMADDIVKKVRKVLSRSLYSAERIIELVRKQFPKDHEV